MSSTTTRAPEQFRTRGHNDNDFHVNELAADRAGALSPYGSDVEFPLPLNKIRYTHPAPEDRPNLAEGR
jgi:hypothetical protein